MEAGWRQGAAHIGGGRREWDDDVFARLETVEAFPAVDAGRAQIRHPIMREHGPLALRARWVGLAIVPVVSSEPQVLRVEDVAGASLGEE